MQFLLIRWNWRHTVEEQARPGEVTVSLGETEDSSAVGKMPPLEPFQSTKRFNRSLECADLQEGECFVFVGRGQVGCDPFDYQ